MDRAPPAARPAHLAGVCYPAQPGELRQLLDRLLARVPAPRGTGDARLLVAPHVDYARGGAGYAHAYREIARSRAELFVVFGTAHASPPHPFTLTRRDYATPLGPVPTDRALADRLASELGPELLAAEDCHREEHSVEFQMLWLRHLFPDRAIRALPVLCSGLSHLPDPRPTAGPFLESLARAVAGCDVCWVAAADLAHAGPLYGDAGPPAAARLEALAAEDRRTLAFLEAGDAEGFHRDAARDDARRRICGAAPIYAAMRASRRGARLLHYQQWSDGTDSVSFAAAAG
jgi:AmmeMemoRadiSam system protein B